MTGFAQFCGEAFFSNAY